MSTAPGTGDHEPACLRPPLSGRGAWSDPPAADTRNECLRNAGRRAAECSGAVAPALAWSVEVGGFAPKPGRGDTIGLWDLLATTAAADVGVARVMEPHLDALAILDQAPALDLEAVGADPGSTWGVYAAEGAQPALTARRQKGRWILDGVKPWCSLARELSHALVTAHTSATTRRLFAVHLRFPGVSPVDAPWVSRGLRQIPSGPVLFTAVPAIAVGEDQWYLTRPGFAWGGAGVAACWWGGAVGIARRLYGQASEKQPDQIALAHLGAVDTALNAARAVLAETATLIDGPDAGTAAIETAAIDIAVRRARAAAARCVEETIARSGHAMGPAPLALDEEHARRVADLQLYVRQHHAERDDAALGGELLARGRAPW